MDRVIENKARKRRPLFWGGGALLGLVLLYFFTQSFSKTIFRIDASRVQIAEVTQGNFDEYIAVTGTVEPLRTVIVVSLESGIVEEKYKEDGIRVEKGEALFKLNNQDLQLDFMNRETALLDQLNNLRNTQINLEQTSYNYQQQLFDIDRQFQQAEFDFKAAEMLMADSLISRQEYQTARSNYHSLKNRQALLKTTTEKNADFKDFQAEQLTFSSSLIRRSLESLRNSLGKLTVRAPASGLLTGLQVEIGQLINKGEKVAEVDLKMGYRLHALVDEIYISRMNKGLAAVIEFGGKAYPLRTDKIYPQVTNGQFRVDLLFDGTAPEGIKYGQSMQIKLSLGEPAPSLLLKRGGFFQKTGGAWVFVVEGNRGLKKSTAFGRQNPDFLEVKEGLKKGDRVIISSYDIFGDADEIILNSD